MYFCNRLPYRISLIFAALLLAGCGGGEKVGPNSSAAPSPSATVAPAAAEPKPSASPQVLNVAASPSPTQNPLLKQAEKQPGTAVAVPESMKRAMTKQEFDKAMKALPPEVRQRIMGLQQAPAPPPSAAPKK